MKSNTFWSAPTRLPIRALKFVSSFNFCRQLRWLGSAVLLSSLVTAPEAYAQAASYPLTVQKKAFNPSNGSPISSAVAGDVVNYSINYGINPSFVGPAPSLYNLGFTDVLSTHMRMLSAAKAPPS